MRATMPAAAVAVAAWAALPTAPDPAQIIDASMVALRADWEAAADYDYTVRERDEKGVRTYDVTMIDGSPYTRLIRSDGRELSPAARQEQDRLFAEARRKRDAETPDARARRLAGYRKDRDEAHDLLEELPRAFTFRLSATRTDDGRTVYVLDARPRDGYDPPSAATQVLQAMHGEFWIDAASHQWIKGTARVLRPVWIEGFLARVQPGTEFEVEQTPVGGGIWLPKRFETRSQSAILFLFHHQTYDERTYFNYRRASDPGGALRPASAPATAGRPRSRIPAPAR